MSRHDGADSWTMMVDGQAIGAHEGDSVATALLAAGINVTRRTPGGAPRGPYCLMGVCFECVTAIDGRPNTRACMTPARDGMVVETMVETRRG